MKEISGFTKSFQDKFGNELQLREYKLNKFQDHLGYGAQSIYTNSHYIDVNAKSDIAPAHSITVENPKPLPGQFNGMLWINTEINPSGITGRNDKGRTYSISYELKGDKKINQRTWESNATILKFYDYGRTSGEVMDSFNKWIKGDYKDFLTKYGAR
jgi:hypothetical protein